MLDVGSKLISRKELIWRERIKKAAMLAPARETALVGDFTKSTAKDDLAVIAVKGPDTNQSMVIVALGSRAACTEPLNKH